MEKPQVYGISDGYGIIGYGFECPHCNKRNDFILDEEDEEQECSECNNVVVVEPMKYSRMK